MLLSPSKTYIWQHDYTLYTHIAKSLFLSLHRSSSSSPRCSLLSFLACDAVSYLRSSSCETRDEAVKLGHCMVQDGLISHVGRLRPFQDDARVFRFNVPRADDIVYRIGITRFPARESTADFQADVDACSNSSLLAFSEASCELTDAELLMADRQREVSADGVGEEEEELNGLHQTCLAQDMGMDKDKDKDKNKDKEAGPQGRETIEWHAEATEFDEPEVAYKVVRCLGFERGAGEGEGEGRGSESASGSAEGGSMQVFANAPAFRRKLSHALMERRENVAREKDGSRRRRGALGFWGKVAIRRGRGGAQA